MIDFIWHGLTCAFWCFVWHKLTHRIQAKQSHPRIEEIRSAMFRQGRIRF